MPDNSRIDDLRRRVQKDPASIAFAQLAEECRRAGEHQEAVDICRAGLEIHPGYLSARVTLGRALVELNQLDEAEAELSRVLESAPENLAAIRGLAEIYHRRGDLVQALAQYRTALLLARNDPDLEQTIDDLSRRIEPAKPAPSGGLTLQHMHDELLKHARPKPQSPPSSRSTERSASSASSGDSAVDVVAAKVAPAPQAAPPPPKPPPSPQSAPSRQSNVGSASSADSAVDVTPQAGGTLTAAADDRATRTVAALEQWLAAIHVPREPRNP